MDSELYVINQNPLQNEFPSNFVDSINQFLNKNSPIVPAT